MKLDRQSVTHGGCYSNTFSILIGIQALPTTSAFLQRQIVQFPPKPGNLSPVQHVCGLQKVVNDMHIITVYHLLAPNPCTPSKATWDMAYIHFHCRVCSSLNLSVVNLDQLDMRASGLQISSVVRITRNHSLLWF